MTPDEMFHDYRMLNPLVSDYTHCLFSEGSDAILTNQMDKANIPYDVFTCMGEELPEKGDIEVVVSQNGNALALIKVTDVRIREEAELQGPRFFENHAFAGCLWLEISFKLIFS